MSGERVDRRIARTRSLLQDALIGLIIEKGYERSTVQDIIDRANVGRATFYAHFSDKRALLDSRLADLKTMLSSQRGPQTSNRFGFSRALLEHARSHLPLYRAIVKRESGGVVIATIRGMVLGLVQTDLGRLGYSKPPTQRELAVEFVAGAFMAVLIWWLEHGARLSLDEVDDVYHRLVMRGLGVDLARQER